MTAFGSIRPWVSALVTVACVFLGAPPSTVALSEGGSGPAHGPGFDPSSDTWTGLSQLVELAADHRIDLEVVDTIDWSSHSPEDVLIVAHPSDALQVDNAARFVVDGGRMLIADEVGRSAAFLDRLGVDLVRVGARQLPHDRFVTNNPALPIFEPAGRHPLLDGVQTVVANHPAVLVNAGGPVVEYADGGGLIYDMNLGDGKVVVFGDASLLINQMLQAGDDAVLVGNTLDYLCAGRTACHVDLVVGSFEQGGRYASPVNADGATSARSRLEAFNQWLDEFMDDLPAAQILYYLGMLLVVGLALYLAVIFRVRPSHPYSDYIDETTRGTPTPQSEFDWNVSRFGQGGRETNFALPLAILEEIFDELFLDALGEWPVSADDPPAAETLGDKFRQRYLGDRPPADARRLEREVIDLLEVLARIPSRHRVFLDSDAYFSERELIKIYRRTRRVLEVMGLQEEYERRTCSVV